MTSRRPVDARRRAPRSNGRDQPWKVAYFGVGNETWGCGGNMTPEYSADLYRRYATFVKAPTRRRPQIDRQRRPATTTTDWTEVLMRKARQAAWTASAPLLHASDRRLGEQGHGDRLHRRASGSRTLERTPCRWTSCITEARRAIMDKYDPAEEGRRSYVDEWGTWYDPEPGTQPGLPVSAEHAARRAGRGASTSTSSTRHADRVQMANIAQMVNVLQAMILTDGPKMVLTPTYWTFGLPALPGRGGIAGDLAVARLCRRRPSASPRVDATAARRADGKIHVALVNIDPREDAASVACRDRSRLQARS